MSMIEHLRRLINHGQSEKYLHSELGYNYRMTEINAAIGRVQACEARGLQPPPAGERRIL